MNSALGSSRISGWGSVLPDKVLTNDDLARTLDTSDEWIQARTGIKERRIGNTTAELAIAAGAKAMEHAGLIASDIDLVVLATTTPDRQMPGTASSVQLGLGLDCGAFDLQAVCSGFVYALVVGNGLASTGANRVLVIGAETMSRLVDWDDRGTAILFGDGAGAVILERTEREGAMLGWSLESAGEFEEALYADHDGGFMKMNGKEVFRQAVTAMNRSCNAAMEQAGVTIDDIALVVPHQANIRILEAASKRLGCSMDKMAQVLEHTGNTSSASVPLALDAALAKQPLSRGDLVLFSGFGAGMTAAAAVMRWEP